MIECVTGVPVNETCPLQSERHTVHAGQQLGHDPPLHVFRGHLPLWGDGIYLIYEQDAGGGALQGENAATESQHCTLMTV